MFHKPSVPQARAWKPLLLQRRLPAHRVLKPGIRKPPRASDVGACGFSSSSGLCGDDHFVTTAPLMGGWLLLWGYYPWSRSAPDRSVLVYTLCVLEQHFGVLSLQQSPNPGESAPRSAPPPSDARRPPRRQESLQPFLMHKAKVHRQSGWVVSLLPTQSSSTDTARLRNKSWFTGP